MIEPLLWMILAHVVADFLLQGPRMAEAKCEGRPRGYLLHFAAHVMSLALFTHSYISFTMVILWVALPAVHLLIDWVKNRFFSPTHPADAAIFLLDQAAHLLLIFCAWLWAAPQPCAPVALFYETLQAPTGKSLLALIFPAAVLPPLPLVAAVYGYIVFGGAVLVRKVLDLEPLRLSGSAAAQGNTRQAGRYIGMLERALILTLTLAGAFTAIAFVLTAKSIARYKELEHRDFAEYYLVGTLLSTFLAVLGGLALKFAVVNVPPF